ncbi:tyrosine-type recombinase/integrase [Sporosarcina ureilytica]|uniref:Tyr recombinase domain-containing protein n=1 Tax=Sporosarcina ureilytica TaxID=298596 RepID=A0A1D8JJ88_9BACL|nr:tyrosine-type recombinase/integrase [Sporosarcina ureilytica]AOV08771.1 hypothetical protein BI350_15280 [Sporosarcina ureilytica]
MIFGKTNNYYSIEAIEAVLKTINLTVPIEKKHFLILSLLYETGARVNEIIHVKVEDIDLSSNPHIKLKSLNTTRTVSLSNQVTKLIRQHITTNGLLDNQRLFYRALNISCAELCRYLGIYIKRARIKHPNLIPDFDSIRGFRISRANHLHQAGLSMEELCYMLGHKNTNQTKRYIGILYHASS